MGNELQIEAFSEPDRLQVKNLWYKCNLVVPENSPDEDINRKLAHSPDLFLVAALEDRIVGTVMGGYDGHRGWINYLAVDPELQGKQIGRCLMERIEERLADTGCPKINLQVRNSNQEALKFYAAIGYSDDEVKGLGKRLVKDKLTDSENSSAN